MPRNFLPATALFAGALLAAVPVSAQEVDNLQLSDIASTGLIQSTEDSPIITNDELLRILSAQSGSSNNAIRNELENVFSGIPDYTSILNGSSAPGSIPQDVWNIMQSQSGNLGGYSDIFSSVEGLISGNSSIGDWGSGVIFDDWGSSFVEGGLSGTRSLPSSEAGQIPDIGDLIPGSQGEIPNVGDVIPQQSSGFPNIFGSFQFPDLSRLNPFRGVMEFLRKTPLATLFGSLSKDIRGDVENNSLGIFTQNPVVKQRDQANLIDQEVARMMAGQRLGEEGAEWLRNEAQEATATLNIGLQSAATAIDTATSAQELTSTQDVAKAVALQGGQNAAISASVLQAQMQNQAALLQLQQLTSSSIQLSADNSEGIDELNRRERVTRTRALHESAEGFVYIPGVFDEEE